MLLDSEWYEYEKNSKGVVLTPLPLPALEEAFVARSAVRCNAYLIFFP